MFLGLLLILVPVVGGLVCFLWSSDRTRPNLIPAFAAPHLLLTLAAVARASDEQRGWLVLDPPGRIVLLLVSSLFAVSAPYAVAYLRRMQPRSNRVFCACLLVFLGMMTFITWSHHLGLMWVAIEATTLSSAPLIYFNRNARSLEATWKYLMVGSVGIALALLGSLFLGYSATLSGRVPSLLFDDLNRNAAAFSKAWLHPAFVLLLVGYGTKMGLAPMHTWKPDAYGEAPGLVGGLLAGGMTSCAFLAILRVFHVLVAAGETAFASRILVYLGLFSMAFAGVFMVRQKDFKRMLAYSSVEHMGILVLGLGLGLTGVFGALLHMVNNGLIKGVMFLSAGNIHRAYGSKSTDDVTGAWRRVPWSGALFLVGFVAVTGSPPFGPFVSEFTILNAAFAQHRYVAAAAFLLFLLVVFMGMGTTVLALVVGEAPPRTAAAARFPDTKFTVLPLLVLLGASLVMGIAMPGAVSDLLHKAAHYVGDLP
ncbi:MAG: proton-conducting transporter membrane subunit [Planctomycetota bacterium]